MELFLMCCIERDKLIVEKTLTYIYPKLCEECRKKFRNSIIEMGLMTADDFAAAMNLSF